MALRQKTNSTNTSTVIRACLDTNVLISAVLFGGKPAEILELAAKEEISLVISPEILAEMSKVLNKKFNWPETNILKEIKAITSISIIVVPKTKIHKISDHSDNRILECAVEGQANYIVTGDKKNLLPLKEFKNIPIITPNNFLKIFK